MLWRVLPLLPESQVAGANSLQGDPPREVALRAAEGASPGSNG